MTAPEYETLTRIVDPSNGGGTTSVRVLHTHVCGEVTILGVFRLSDDSEIPFESLSLDDQCRVEEACDKESKQQNKTKK